MNGKTATINVLLRSMVVVIVATRVPALRAQVPCLKQAWQDFKGNDYEAAIKSADACIDQFGRQADRDEAKLAKDGVPRPPTGAVEDAEKHRIFIQGVLNDVGTAYFIKGRSAEFLYAKGKKREQYKNTAVEAYKSACKYKYARTWDPQGWFWSPCEASSDRLQGLK